MERPKHNNIFRIHLLLAVATSLLLLALVHNIVFADTTYAPANYYAIPAKVTEGNIISFIDGKYQLSSMAYDQFMIGSVTSHPAITQDITGPFPFYPVINSGDGYVLVTTSNGTIKKGDYITSSTIPGVGQKATKAGYTIGVAEEDYTASNKRAVGKISVSLNIHYFIGNVQVSSKLLDILTLSALATYESPSLVVKYMLAAFLVGLGLLFSFILISRTASKGIDALGRNPLSSLEIHIGIALNIFIALMILMTGFVMGFLVLKI